MHIWRELEFLDVAVFGSQHSTEVVLLFSVTFKPAVFDLQLLDVLLMLLTHLILPILEFLLDILIHVWPLSLIWLCLEMLEAFALRKLLLLWAIAFKIVLILSESILSSKTGSRRPRQLAIRRVASLVLRKRMPTLPHLHGHTELITRLILPIQQIPLPTVALLDLWIIEDIHRILVIGIRHGRKPELLVDLPMI